MLHRHPAARSAWCSRTRTTRSSPMSWRRTSPLRRKTSASRPQEIRQRVDDALRAVGMYDYRTLRPAAPVRRAEAARRHRGRARHAAAVRRARRADCHARPAGPATRCLIPSQRLNRETGMTVILITHHMDEAVTRGPRDRHVRGQDRRRRNAAGGLRAGGAAAQRRPRRAADRAAAAGTERSRGGDMSDRRVDCRKHARSCAGSASRAAEAGHRRKKP